jgi:hypothetical protein
MLEWVCFINAKLTSSTVDGNQLNYLTGLIDKNYLHYYQFSSSWLLFLRVVK